MSESEITAQPKRSAAFLKADWFIMVCLYLGTLTLHILMTLCTTIFNLTPDEYCVTAVAAYINGLDWSSTVSAVGYYGYFQSLFYIPVFSITDDPYLRYRLMVIINGVLMSLAPVIIYYLARKPFEVKKSAAVLLAVISGLYPCYMLLTKYTWNETLCNLLPWVFLLLMYKASGSVSTVKKQIFSALAGLTLVAAYATHGRMLALLAAGVVLVPIVYFSMKKKRIFCFTGFYSAVVVGFIADKLTKSWIQHALWKIGDGSAPTNTIEKTLSRLFAAGESGVTAGKNLSIERLFDTLVGHFFYFFSSTWGYGAVAVVVIITAIVLYYVRRNKPVEYDEEGKAVAGTGPYIDDNMMTLCWFTLLAMGAIFVVSVAFKSTSTLFYERMDTVMYGRYTEVLYPVALFALGLLIYKGKLGLLQSFFSLCLATVINVLTEWLVVPIVLGADRFVSAMIMGLAPLRYGEGMKELYSQLSFTKIIATTMIILFVLVVVKLLRRDDKNMYLYYMVPLSCLLIYSGASNYYAYTVPQSKNAQTGATYMQQALDKLDENCDSVAFVNLARDKQVKGQFLYPELNVELVSSFTKLSQMETLPETMLANREDCLNMWLDGVYLVGDPSKAICLYVTTPEAAQRYRDMGYCVSEGKMADYDAAHLPSTSSVVKNGLAENADLDLAQSSAATAVALLPSGSAVYTNYFTAHKMSDFIVTVYGSGVSEGRISVTADKGETALEYEVISAESDKLIVRFSVSKKTENIRFKLSSGGTEPMEVSRLTVELAPEETQAEPVIIQADAQ